MVPIPTYAEVMTVADFQVSCRLGHFNDYDGLGYYANPPNMNRDAPISCSDFARGLIKPGYSHVAWFNK